MLVFLIRNAIYVALECFIISNISFLKGTIEEHISVKELWYAVCPLGWTARTDGLHAVGKVDVFVPLAHM